MRMVLPASLLLLVVPLAARAQAPPARSPGGAPASAPAPGPAPEADAAAYCAYTTGVAASESALEMAPTLFGTAGLVSGADVSPGGSVLGPTTRVIAGVSYSAAALYRGIAIRAGAEAECRRYRAVSELRAFLETRGLARAGGTGETRLLVTDMPSAFRDMATSFLGDAVGDVEQVDL